MANAWTVIEGDDRTEITHGMLTVNCIHRH